MIRRFSLATVMAAVLVLSSCGADKPSADPTPSPTSAAPSPSATGPVAPVLPEAAKVNDDAGAKAFVEYWFAAVTYAMQTGDTDVMDRHSGDDCEACEGVSRSVRKIYKAGKENRGGGWAIERLEEQAASTEKLRLFLALVNQPAQALVNSDGSTLNADPAQKFAFEVWASFGESGWLLRELREVRSAG